MDGLILALDQSMHVLGEKVNLGSDITCSTHCRMTVAKRCNCYFLWNEMTIKQIPTVSAFLQTRGPLGTVASARNCSNSCTRRGLSTVKPAHATQPDRPAQKDYKINQVGRANVFLLPAVWTVKRWTKKANSTNRCTFWTLLHSKKKHRRR